MKTEKHPFRILGGIAAVLIISLLVLVTIVLVINVYMIQSTTDQLFARTEYIQAIAADAQNPDRVTDGFDAALVLGCGVYNNAVPSPLLRERLDTAIELYHAGAVAKLVMSGDHGQIEYNEVRVMKQYAIQNGVPSEDIFKDHAGFSTYESVYRIRDVFGAERILIVTQEYHLYRALYIANSLDVGAIGVRADRARLGGQTTRDLREILARCKDFVYCLTKPEPTFLGDPIDLSGNGDVTND